jgi:GNAT superfamily N-acetyltransferase
MTTNKIEIISYASSYHSELLRLLLELQSTYFSETASRQIREVRQDKDVKKSYGSYLDMIDNGKDNLWKILLAKINLNNIIGFIIGSISIDEELVLSKTGTIEDWFVEQEFRGQGIGMQLYNELERWFIEKGCKQVQSDTWEGNQLSIKAHQQMGFFISGIKFSKRL